MQLKSIEDYYDLICKEFLNIPKKDVKRILQFGWKLLYLHNSYGCDVMLLRGSFWMYCGKLMKDSVLYFNYYKKKLATKLRILYKRNKIQWDGYYYFSLSLNQYDLYKSLKNKKGRPKKIFNFENIFIRKIYEECLLVDGHGVAIFKIHINGDLGFDYYIKSLKTDKALLVIEKLPTKMKDILASNYNYEIVKNKKYKI